MGYFFENMEKLDIQAERRKTLEERQKTAEQAKLTVAETKRADEAEAERDALLLENQKLKEQLAAFLNS